MGITSGMKVLAEDIASSHEKRLKSLGEVRKSAKQASRETQDLLKGFRAYRDRTTAQQRRDLARETANRRAEVMGLRREAQGLKTGFQTSRREEGTRMRQELAQGIAGLRSGVRGMLTDAQQTIKSFGSHREDMAAELRRDLKGSRTASQSEVSRLREVARAQLKDFGKAQAKVRDELNEARAAWQNLSPVREARKPKEPTRAKAPIVEEQIPDLEDRLLRAITEHPSGISLAEVAESLGVVPVVLGRASKSLLEGGRVRKEDRLYFPAG